MLRDDSTEPMVQHSTALTLPGAARAAQIMQAQVDAQETMTTLADQLLVLFDEIPTAGLIRQQRRAMGQHVQTYFRLADSVWEALAADQLHELTSNAAYAIAADALEQKLIQIHEECQQADHNPKARGGWLWRRRARHYSRALLDWKRCMDSGSSMLPDPTACGRALYRAHGRVGLAGLHGFNYFLVISLPTLGILTSLLLAALLGTMNVLLPTNLPKSLTPTILAGLSTLFILWFSTTGPSSLPLIVGYAVTRRRSILFAQTLRASISVRLSPGPLRIALRILLTLLGTLCLLALLGMLAVTAFVAQNFFSTSHTGSTQDISGYMNSLILTNLGQSFQPDSVIFTLLFPVIGLLLVILFFLPFTLSVQAGLVRALIAHPTHSPEARRYALQPALELLSFHSIILLFIAILANSIANLGTDSLLPDGWPLVSQRLLVYVAALIAPYVLLVDLPFREGMARWRSARLHDLALRRSEIAQRLSRSQPQATDQTDLRTFQDYITWQYYYTQEGEVKDASAAPFSIQRRVLWLVLAIIGGIALDQINQLLHSLV
ncbi:MAG TPA: hypothetical protein VKT82_15260 [Ktedonobacterales bacterium]|nr:hypothetical protein [Ktedonobacterales bacterium]